MCFSVYSVIASYVFLSLRNAFRKS